MTAAHRPHDPPPTIIMVAGFGDTASVFDPLRNTALAQAYRLLPMNLPGFGAPALAGETTLARLAEAVDGFARRENGRIVLAHSVASIIASLAAQRPGSPIDTILSLEGNLTAEDAYFSGTAAQFDDASAFHAAFLRRLGKLAESHPVAARYRDQVARADPIALWQFGKDVNRFSAARVPGDVLSRAPYAVYFYNPANLPAASLAWLERSALKRVRLDDASHWKCFEQPALLAEKIRDALAARA